MADQSDTQPQEDGLKGAGEGPPESSEKERESVAEVIHKTKTINFFGRSTPIILQNDNGPCPLLAICNVLLLRNQLNLNPPDVNEVSQEKLLSLVAERLIDSNSNVNRKDAGYVNNQQQNIGDAIDLLPQLTTGIDVNTQFRRIDDFEFTRECAVFDLLDIPLYHGWLVDPQDHETAEAIGSKSYNTITSCVVYLEEQKMKNECRDKVDEDCIDFAAATTATLGVPSPNLSRGKSFDDSQLSAGDQQIPKKGDAEEEAELRRVLKMSESESPRATTSVSVSSHENFHMVKSVPANHVFVSEDHTRTEIPCMEPSVSGSVDVPGHCESNVLLEDQPASVTSRDAEEKQIEQSIGVKPVEGSLSTKSATHTVDTPILNDATPSLINDVKDTVPDQEFETLCSSTPDVVECLHKQNGEENESPLPADSRSSSGRVPGIEAVESFTSSLDGSEPIYEGEECILDTGITICENKEPVYEGEVVLAEQIDKGEGDVCDASPKDVLTLQQAELINNFLRSNASQLTFYGLFCLQEGLKERELCVFFRNNHFSTMFKFEGELYLLATDQGYMNQPDLVWEKLNEVNGDTLFMTSNFTEFKLESSANGSWDQQNAVSSTADYLASIDSSAPDGSNMNSDLQLAIALQQQEFEEQQQQPQRNTSQQPSASGSSRLITGPQVPRSSGKATSSTSKPDHKSKDKSSNCRIM